MLLYVCTELTHTDEFSMLVKHLREKANKETVTVGLLTFAGTGRIAVPDLDSIKALIGKEGLSEMVNY